MGCSRYATQLERYVEHFPREQLLVVTSEALRTDRRATVQGVYDFLGVDAGRVPEVIDTEFYRTAERRTYPPLVWWARRIAKRHLLQPTRTKQVVDSMLTRRAERAHVGAAHVDPGCDGTDAIVSAELRARVADLLRDDVARLRAYLPPDFDGWGLA